MTTPIPFTPTDPRELAIVLAIDAPRAAIWRCWTESGLLKQWYCPKPWVVPEADFDLRPGGRMNVVMAGPNGERVEYKGCWLHIVTQESLAFTGMMTEDYFPQPDGFMSGYVQLSDLPGGLTKMIWGARHADMESVQKHREMGFEKGWAAAATQLETLARTLR